MREIIKIILSAFIIMIVFYLVIAFLCWDINLLDDIAEHAEARVLTLLLIAAAASFGAGLTINEDLK